MSDRRLQSSRNNPPQVVQSEPTSILGNTLEQQVETPVELTPEVDINNTNDLISTKQKENNIGAVNTPEQRVGNNNKSDNLPFEKNTPKNGSKPFTQTKSLFPVPENENSQLDKNVGFQFKRGNFFAQGDKDTLLPEPDVFKVSEKKDIVDALKGGRPTNFEEFFN